MNDLLGGVALTAAIMTPIVGGLWFSKPITATISNGVSWLPVPVVRKNATPIARVVLGVGMAAVSAGVLISRPSQDYMNPGGDDQ
jgi:hypothetical protein